MSETRKLLQKRRNEAVLELAAIRDEAAPLRSKRDNLLLKIVPLEAAARDLQQEIKAIEQPRLAALTEEISALDKVLGPAPRADGEQVIAASDIGDLDQALGGSAT